VEDIFVVVGFFLNFTELFFAIQYTFELWDPG